MNGPAPRGAASETPDDETRRRRDIRGFGHLQIVSLIVRYGLDWGEGRGGERESDRSIRGGCRRPASVYGFFATVLMLMELDRLKLPNRLIRGERRRFYLVDK